MTQTVTIPTRVQRKRTKGSRLPPGTLCCTRPGFWANPFTGANAAGYYRIWLKNPDTMAQTLLKTAEYFGHDVQLAKRATVFWTGQRHRERLPELLEYQHLACWCSPDANCHVDAIIDALKQLIQEMRA